MASAGRPISITDDVWDGVMDGLLRGASIVSMARQYNISVGSIRKKKLPEEAKRIRALVEGERKLMLKKLSENASEIESLALNAHCSTSTSENPTNPISDIMSNIIFHLAIAAHRMAKATRNQVEKFVPRRDLSIRGRIFRVKRQGAQKMTFKVCTKHNQKDVQFLTHADQSNS